MSPMLSPAAILGASWLMLAGHHTRFLLSAGAASVLLVAGLSRRIGIIDDETGHLCRNRRPPPFGPWISRQTPASIVSREICSLRTLPPAYVIGVGGAGLVVIALILRSEGLPALLRLILIMLFMLFTLFTTPTVARVLAQSARKAGLKPIHDCRERYR